MPEIPSVAIFDIQRSSLHDGPGIRTTVFLKGCPLHCAWCHNPESQQTGRQLKCVFKKCVSCGRCADVCDHDVHTFVSGKHVIQFEHCTVCGKCVQTCPTGALQIVGYKEKVTDIVQLALRDRKFYLSTGGGITLSGGEPFLQEENTVALLREAKKEGLHTCVETSGFAKWELIRDASTYIDIFLFDYKLTDPELHRQYIGVDNRLILQNLRNLCESGSSIILRCPIIPGVNDNDSHLQAITDLSNQYDAIREVNIMPYHDTAVSKIPQIGYMGNTWIKPSMKREDTKNIHEKLFSMGCTKLNPTA